MSKDKKMIETFKNMGKNFFISPSKIFEDYIEKPNYGANFIILGILSVVAALFLSPMARQSMDKLANGSDEKVAKMMRSINNFTTNPYVLSVSKLITLFIGIYIVALLYFIVLRIIKVNINYSKTVCIYSLAYIPIAVDYLIKAIYSFATKSDTISVKNAVSYLDIFKTYDIFKFWQIVLLIIGISTVGKISKKKAFLLILTISVINITYIALSIKFTKSFQSNVHIPS